MSTFKQKMFSIEWNKKLNHNHSNTQHIALKDGNQSCPAAKTKDSLQTFRGIENVNKNANFFNLKNSALPEKFPPPKKHVALRTKSLKKCEDKKKVEGHEILKIEPNKSYTSSKNEQPLLGRPFSQDKLRLKLNEKCKQNAKKSHFRLNECGSDSKTNQLPPLYPINKLQKYVIIEIYIC